MVFSTLLSYFKAPSQYATESQFASKFRVESSKSYASVKLNDRLFWELFKVIPIQNDKLENLMPSEPKTLFVLRYDGRKNTFSGEDADPNYPNIDQSLRQYARSFVQKLKTIKHPSILQYIDSFELRSKVYIVTEYCQPLPLELQRLKSSLYFDSNVAWGLYQIVDVLYFFHKNGIYLNSLSSESIFVTNGGDWKLGNLAFLSQNRDEERIPMESAQGAQTNQPADNQLTLPDIIRAKGRGFQLLEKYIAPEFIREDPSIDSYPGKVDSWGMAVLLFEVFLGTAGIPYTNHSQIEKIAPSTIGKFPAKIQAPMKAFSKSSLKERGEISSFFRSTYFTSNDYINSLLFIQELSLKEQIEIDEFMDDLATRLEERNSTFPFECIKYRIFPTLISSIKYGSASKSTIKTLFMIGSQLSDAEYKTIFIPQILELFSKEDHLVQLSILQNIVQIVNSIESDEIVEYKVFRGGIEKWFQSSVSKIREMSVKSLIPIVSRLQHNCIDTIVVGLLWGLLSDPEGSIRTNTIIVIGKIADELTPSAREKLLLPAIARTLKDPFRHCRYHSLQVLCDTLDSHTPVSIASKIIPLISSRMLDPSPEIRKVTIDTLSKLVEKMRILNEEDKIVPKKDEEKADEAEGSSSFSWSISSVVKKVIKLPNDKTDQSDSSEKKVSNTNERFGTLPIKKGIESSISFANNVTESSNDTHKQKKIQPLAVKRKENTAVEDQWAEADGWEELIVPSSTSASEFSPDMKPLTPMKVTHQKKASSSLTQHSTKQKLSKSSNDDPFETDNNDIFGDDGWEIDIPTIPVMRTNTKKRSDNWD